MIQKFTRLSNQWAALIIAAVGCVVFFSGLSNPFQGDDSLQIVSNPIVHSLANIGQFFTGGTFYFGQGHLQLAGAYYRPLQTTSYSALYTIFGPNPVFFHALQMLLCGLSAYLLYRFFKSFLNPNLALFLSLLFLVHPANSQVAFDIPYLQDALFFFFGILGLALLLRFNSNRSLALVIACLFVSLLGKETGIFFVIMAVTYLIVWDRTRLYAFLGLMLVPIVLYVALRANAIGWNPNPDNGPIDHVDLGVRLLTAPSIVLFYITRFVWPVPLGSGYFWVHSAFTFQDVVLPLLIDLCVIGAILFVGLRIRRKGTERQHKSYWFFFLWATLGVMAHMQIIPLDETASETYMYFPVAGVLGMIGVAVSVLVTLPRIDRRLVLAATAALILLLGIRTVVRGTDYSSQYNLSLADIASSSDNYNSYRIVAFQMAHDGQTLDQAVKYAQDSVNIYPNFYGYNTLGIAYMDNGEYPEAISAFQNAISYERSHVVTVSDETIAYDNLGLITLYYGDYSANRANLIGALKTFPQDGYLWQDLAILDQRNNNHAEALVAVANSQNFGVASSGLVNAITNNEPLNIGPRPTS